MTADSADHRGWESDVIDFWYSLSQEDWWRGDAGLDERIRGRFLDLWTDLRDLPPTQFLNSPEQALAAVILFDQFSRNMFRGEAYQYSTDPLARAIARQAVDREYDEALPADRRYFLYMPLMHSEDIDDQRRSLLLFTALGDDELLQYAKKHHDVIDRFGRFPHRNAVLGRQPREAEEEADAVKPW